MNILSRQQYIEVCGSLRILGYRDGIDEYEDNRRYSDGELFIEMARKIKELDNETQ